MQNWPLCLLRVSDFGSWADTASGRLAHLAQFRCYSDLWAVSTKDELRGACNNTFLLIGFISSLKKFLTQVCQASNSREKRFNNWMVQQQEQLRLLPPGGAPNEGASGLLYPYSLCIHSHGEFGGLPAVHWLLQSLRVASPLPDCDAEPWALC